MSIFYFIFSILSFFLFVSSLHMWEYINTRNVYNVNEKKKNQLCDIYKFMKISLSNVWIIVENINIDEKLNYKI